ncbi:synaptojanin [Acrasis kona]|uniref:Synaptojanin n=1 Tax=Acrasis kona TaxID=1008807 RepID=A0AAW2ZMS1_9EUKA
MFNKAVPPILRSTPLVDAPGHNGITISPNMVDQIIVYHARSVPFFSPGDRLPYLSRLFWNADKMFMESPTLAINAVPDWPLFTSVYRNSASKWIVKSGDWKFSEQVGFEYHQLSISCKDQKTPSVISPNAPPLLDYIFELNYKNLEKSSGGVTIRAIDIDQFNYLDVTIQSSRRSLTINAMFQSERMPEQIVKLIKDNYNEVNLHRITIIKRSSHVTIKLDDIIHSQILLKHIPASPSSVSLIVRNTTAVFSGISITHFYEHDFNDKLDSFWMVKDGEWSVDRGTLYQNSLSGLILRGQPTYTYELTCDVHLLDAINATSTSGVVAAYNSIDAEVVFVGFQKSYWPSAQLVVTRSKDGNTVESYSVPLPRGFLYDQSHNIRVSKQRDLFTVYLDNYEMLSHRFESLSGESYSGLYTQGTKASFDNMRWKRLGVDGNLLLNGGFETQFEGNPQINGNPWLFEGSVKPNMCCAHTGLFRAVFTYGKGFISQKLTCLPVGTYVVVVYLSGSSNQKIDLSILADGQAVSQVDSMKTLTGETAWEKHSLEFNLVKDTCDIVVVLSADITTRKSIIAADDFYLWMV